MKMSSLPYNSVSKIVVLLAFLSISSAYIVEFIFGFQPCKLCIYQRVPYFFMIVIGFFDVFINSKNVSRVTNYIYSVSFFIGFLLAIYHVGVEHGLILETCSSSSVNSLHDLKNMILNNHISCKDVQFRILGFSMAEVNALFSLSCSIGICWNCYQRHKIKN